MTLAERWMGDVDGTLRAHRRELDDLGDAQELTEKDVIALRLDVRGLLVRVSIYAALAAAIATAVITPVIYLALAHFAGSHPGPAALP